MCADTTDIGAGDPRVGLGWPANGASFQGRFRGTGSAAQNESSSRKIRFEGMLMERQGELWLRSTERRVSKPQGCGQGCACGGGWKTGWQATSRGCKPVARGKGAAQRLTRLQQ